MQQQGEMPKIRRFIAGPFIVQLCLLIVVDRKRNAGCINNLILEANPFLSSGFHKCTTRSLLHCRSNRSFDRWNIKELQAAPVVRLSRISNILGFSPKARNRDLKLANGMKGGGAAPAARLL